ncbi:amidase domain-containing protein [Caldibacillus thermolactis]|jgi:cell wall-associated NlpC family hydrolase|uniref:Amidase domain-containing protein n=1 Tax=Pallidibacillus thermolactis TaxID=251051 RepID=A0ABT2WDE2_9BACI|nr:amidase domain-containing protein [Pallidibacillus thermolactis]MCU9593525.1 amidase domain-containing protein [Pallidibacillus thermolactis]MCU9602767.1 amidase domain-containing protein [Pallidibacillus thermolactis subsp. kokeshiiformis]MED1672456.1 amidase domain-containing protein [Pallidibacillus thermolactis subsp. kokeshiiformis]
MDRQIKEILESKVQQCVRNDVELSEKMKRKKASLLSRDAEIIKAKATGKIIEQVEREDYSDIYYQAHFQYLIKQHKRFYIEEEVEKRKASFYKNSLISDDEVTDNLHSQSPDLELVTDESRDMETRTPYRYDRRKAVQYAERWWNDYNPAYKKFTDDCTNYISQCLHAGGAPMRGFPNRNSGWWYNNNNWSYSWSVAHALNLYLGTSKTGLRAKEVEDPRELQLGDVICYDFEGDGRFNHNTIVTGKDAYGYPLVNAHTYNSRMRYWAYEDSSAYTPNIQYKFYTIIDDY